jgi:hypothetical protein
MRLFVFTAVVVSSLSLFTARFVAASPLVGKEQDCLDEGLEKISKQLGVRVSCVGPVRHCLERLETFQKNSASLGSLKNSKIGILFLSDRNSEFTTSGHVEIDVNGSNLGEFLDEQAALSRELPDFERLRKEASKSLGVKVVCYDPIRKCLERVKSLVQREANEGQRLKHSGLDTVFLEEKNQVIAEWGVVSINPFSGNYRAFLVKQSEVLAVPQKLKALSKAFGAEVTCYERKETCLNLIQAVGPTKSFKKTPIKKILLTDYDSQEIDTFGRVRLNPMNENSVEFLNQQLELCR